MSGDSRPGVLLPWQSAAKLVRPAQHFRVPVRLATAAAIFGNGELGDGTTTSSSTPVDAIAAWR